METFKVKSALFSLLAILTLSVFMTSCEYDLVERLDTTHYINQPISPVGTTDVSNDDEILKSILSTSKGKLKIDDTGQYRIDLNYGDLNRSVYQTLNEKHVLNISKGFTIPAEDVATIFCVAENLCLVEGDFTLKRTQFYFDKSAGSTGSCFNISRILFCIN